MYAAAAVEMWRHNLCAKDVDITSAKIKWVWLLLVTLATIRMKQMNLISCVVFPTLLRLQTILSYLHSWIQKWILNITGIHIPYRVNDNHVIVMSLLHEVVISVTSNCCSFVSRHVFNLTIKEVKPELVLTNSSFDEIGLTPGGLLRPNI